MGLVTVDCSLLENFLLAFLSLEFCLAIPSLEQRLFNRLKIILNIRMQIKQIADTDTGNEF